MNDDPNELLSVTQVATLLKVHRQTVAGWIRSGKLEAHRTPGAWAYRIPRRALFPDTSTSVPERE